MLIALASVTLYEKEGRKYMYSVKSNGKATRTTAV